MPRRELQRQVPSGKLLVEPFTGSGGILLELTKVRPLATMIRRSTPTRKASDGESRA